MEGLAQRMQSRAEEVTREVRDLEDRAGAAERDLSGAIGAFRRLSDTHFVENASNPPSIGNPNTIYIYRLISLTYRYPIPSDLGMNRAASSSYL